ncbi:MAG TPA: hypothetical protein VFX70_20560 [Mycobacteriales bacterium]|nr:hypothetical protein [Mycobacteriales bacterium]
MPATTGTRRPGVRRLAGGLAWLRRSVPTNTPPLTGMSARADRRRAQTPRSRLLARIGSFVAVCMLVVLVPAAPAFAGACTIAPTPEAPGQGVAGFFLPKPNPVPPAEDPFAPGAKTTPFEQFGLAGLSWYLYDPGCGGAVRDPSGSISSWAGRTLFIPAKAGVASVVAVSGAALHPTFLNAFDPLLKNLTDALHKAIFTPLAPLAVMLTGLLLLARSTRQRVSESTTAVGWAVLVMVVAAALFAYPLKAGHAADRAIGGAVGVVSRGLTSSNKPPAQQVADEMYNAFLYRMWLTGEFCDPDSNAARKFGPDILRAQAFNWSEAQQAARQGSGPLVLTHKALFDQTAGKVQSTDPVAYECLAGHSSAPLEASILGDLGILIMAPFLLMGGLILIAAYIIIRFAVILGPALLTAGAFFPLRGVVQAAVRVVTAALINSVVFTICTLFVIRVDTTVLDPATALPAWLRLVLLGVVTVVMWYLTRPFRKLTAMVTPRSFADSLSEAGASWRARAGSLLRRRARAEDIREAVEEAIDDTRQPERAGTDARMREEARGPVGMPRAIRVSAQRVARAEAIGYPSGGGFPAVSPAGVRGALPAPPGDTFAAILDGDGRPPVTAGPGAGRGSPLPSGRQRLPELSEPWLDEPERPDQVPVTGTGGDPYRGIAPVGPVAPVGSRRPEPYRDSPATTRQTAHPGPGRVPVQVSAEGLFDPAAPYRPNPEDSPPAAHQLRHVRPQVVDGEEVFQLYDPGADPLAGNDPWSR